MTQATELPVASRATKPPWSTRWLLAPAALVIGLGASPLACGDETPPTLIIGDACALNSDCDAPLVCAFSRCHTQCASDRDCSGGQRCVEAVRPNRVCQLTDETTCTYNSQCPGEEVCAIDDHCRDQCAADRDCAEGQRCSSGTCATPTELVDGGLVGVDGGTGLGQPCAYNSDCEEGVCRANGFCGLECITSADCAGGAPCTKNRCEYTDIFCVPGQVFQCFCEDDPDGHHRQICNDAGVAVGACDCPTP